MTKVESCKHNPDDEFGPVIVSCARTFDFTLLFEHSVLSEFEAPEKLLATTSMFKMMFEAAEEDEARDELISTTETVTARISRDDTPSPSLFAKLVLRLLWRATHLPKAILTGVSVLVRWPASHVYHPSSLLLKHVLACMCATKVYCTLQDVLNERTDQLGLSKAPRRLQSPRPPFGSKDQRSAA